MTPTRILVCIPIKPTLHPGLRDRCVALASALPAANPGLNLALDIDTTPIPPDPADCRPWSKVCRIRNRMLDRIDRDAFDFLLWIDADVIDYPADMPTRLLAGNPAGISAPLVLIEGTDRSYDWAAFVMAGKDHVLPTDRRRVWGRNLAHEPPYWHEHDPPRVEDDAGASPRWYEPAGAVVNMDCVGTITLVPTWVYRRARYEDHPAFTDHYPLCLACRQAGQRVTVDRSLIAYHADLPKWGEEWH